MEHDGWVRDPNALLTILALKMVEVGDECEFYDRDTGKSYTKRVDGPNSVERVLESYNNPELHSTHDIDKGKWKLLGWRRPLKEKL